MTLAQRIAQLRAQMAAKLAERNSKVAELEQLRDDENTTDEQVQAVRSAKAALDADIDALQLRVSELEAEQAQDDAYARLSAQTAPAAAAARAPAYDEVTRVGSEPRTYSRESDPAGKQFLRDVAASFLGHFEARDRLVRHLQEERVHRGDGYAERAVGTGAFAGLTVPQYLTDLYAPAAAAGRPFANIHTKLDLPSEGMTVNISRITTASSAAAQTENVAASETNMDDTLLTENVLTVAGQQTMSRQAIERGTGTEQVVVSDLFRRYHTALDSKLINDAVTGLTNTAQSVAYTDATPTAAELYPKILNAQANLEGVMLDLGVDGEFAVMHSRRWAWLQSQVSATWPFIAQPGIPTQAGGVNDGTAYGSGVRGVLPNGTKVIVDNNIGTTLGAGTEDEIYVVNAGELFLWEDPSAPVFIRAEQPAAASLGVLLVVYGYFAYTNRRYTNGQQKIAGTGLIAPTF